MSQRDDFRDRPVNPQTGAYTTASSSSAQSPDVRVAQANISTAADRVRWGPVWAGIFASISTMFLMALLGIAIGLSAYDAAENTRGFGIGAGVWQLITVIVAFLVGGWIAGRTGGWPARRSGWINGALVWAVTIPILLYMLTSGVAGVLTNAGNMAAQLAPQAQQIRAQSGQTGQDAAQQASAQMQDAAGQVRDAASGRNPPDEETVNRAQGAAWWTFASFALGLAAAAAGGAWGASSERKNENAYGNVATA